MPELPEVEVVRAGVHRWISGRTVADVEVLHPRAIRRHLEGPRDFADRLIGTTVVGASRRGKYLWLPLSTDGEAPETALVGHLGMSGQLLVIASDAPDERHLRVRFRFADDGPELRFVDQRTFGGLAVAELVDDGAGGHVPAPVAHIGRDPLDPAFDEVAFVRTVRSKPSEIKRILLDQTVASGVGNIYADEALWRAKVHGARPGSGLTRGAVTRLLADVREVMSQAIAEGGTSFDALYVNVNGESGYFDRRLAAYGQEGQPCPRCGTPIRRITFMNRSSFFCPRCQPWRPHGRAPQHAAARER
ncbi:MAG: bifunctional DNA-formamidopyrimidine glycosylase/DNA-(apurinic or apyrimidinic site) lyase [Actinobacteria bacterium]|nr:bifunctional DNA-formamidopyrimidine glycosylase/DNA-(apurinic or apyrimidinic site) lyase [Actinomycetota bacterium]